MRVPDNLRDQTKQKKQRSLPSRVIGTFAVGVAIICGLFLVGLLLIILEARGGDSILLLVILGPVLLVIMIVTIPVAYVCLRER